MAAVFNAASGIGNETFKVWDAIAHRIKKKPKDGFKAEGQILSVIALISEATVNSFENVANLFKDAKSLSALFNPLSTFIEGNAFAHTAIDFFKGNETAYNVGLAALEVLIPVCETAKLFHDYSIVQLDRTLPFFTSITFKQMFGIAGGTFLALRFIENSYQTVQKIRNPNLANDRLKNKWKLVGQVALATLGTFLVACNIMGVFYTTPILALGIISLVPNFAVQYIEDEEERQRAAAV